jgi:hypothetical protein
VCDWEKAQDLTSARWTAGSVAMSVAHVISVTGVINSVNFFATACGFLTVGLRSHSFSYCEAFGNSWNSYCQASVRLLRTLRSRRPFDLARQSAVIPYVYAERRRRAACGSRWRVVLVVLVDLVVVSGHASRVTEECRASLADSHLEVHAVFVPAARRVANSDDVRAFCGK